MTQHNDTPAAPTPGPWAIVKYRRWHKGIKPSIVVMGNMDGVIGTAHGVALVNGPANVDMRGELEANARLIAAAPALAEALQGMIRGALSGVTPRHVYEQARAALKAAGLDK